jgi:hypothetical protein
MQAYRATKFAKKIDGHTMFNQDKDMETWRNPWKFMYDVMLPADAESSFEHREFQQVLEDKRKQKEKWLELKKALANKYGEKLTTHPNQGPRLGKKQTTMPKASNPNSTISAAYKVSDTLKSSSVSKQNSPPNEAQSPGRASPDRSIMT